MIGIIIVVCEVLLVGGSLILGIMNNRNENYWKYNETKGEIEAQYTALGTYEVSTVKGIRTISMLQDTRRVEWER